MDVYSVRVPSVVTRAARGGRVAATRCRGNLHASAARFATPAAHFNEPAGVCRMRSGRFLRAVKAVRWIGVSGLRRRSRTLRIAATGVQRGRCE